MVGEYVVESKLGQGGFGTVFRASHPLIGKLAAIKVLSRKYSSDPEMVARFIDEARAVNQIRHRSIIDIFSFGHLEDGRCYYVMELLDGRPLGDLIEHNGGLPLARAIPILRAIARALDAAHAQGIAHRDLKPDNVFLATQPDGTEYPKLLDFGIAKLMGELTTDPKYKTATGAPIGTPCYMSPEQCRGLAVDHRTDIYAFGCVVYEMLTGRVPFDGEDHLTVMVKQISEEPVPPTQRARETPTLPELPLAVDDVIAWMMRKEPAERPPDLISAIHALEQAALAAGISLVGDERTVSDRFTPLPKRPVAAVEAAPTLLGQQDQPARRSRAWMALAGVTVIAIAVVAIVALARGGDDTEITTAKPTAPQAPAYVLIEIVGPPDGTEVFGPEGPLGRTPTRAQLRHGSTEVQLTLRAEGYLTTVTRVMPDADRRIEVALEKKIEPTPPAAPPIAKPVTKPVAKLPVAKPITKPITKPETTPAIEPDPYGRK